MNRQPIIFLSAVSGEFRGYRAQMREDLIRAGNFGIKIQEEFDVVGEGTLLGLDERIKGCDAVVHLIGDMAGFIPPPVAVKALVGRYPDLHKKLGFEGDTLSAISYTQWEAYLAIYHGKKLFIAEATVNAQR